MLMLERGRWWALTTEGEQVLELEAHAGAGVIDLRALKLARVLRGVSDPEQIAVSRDGTRLDGWAHADGTDQHLTVVVPELWQQFPGGFRLADVREGCARWDLDATVIGDTVTRAGAEPTAERPSSPARRPESLFDGEAPETDLPETIRPRKRHTGLFDAEQEGWT